MYQRDWEWVKNSLEQMVNIVASRPVQLKKSSKTPSFFLQLTECMKMCSNIFVSHTITFGRPFPQIVNIFVFSYRAVSNIFSQTHLTLVLHRQLATGWKMWKVKSPDTFSLYTLLQSASDLDLYIWEEDLKDVDTGNRKLEITLQKVSRWLKILNVQLSR